MCHCFKTKIILFSSSVRSKTGMEDSNNRLRFASFILVLRSFLFSGDQEFLECGVVMKSSKYSKTE